MNISYISHSNINNYKTDILDITNRSAPSLFDDVTMSFNFTQRLHVATQNNKVIGFITTRKLCISSFGGNGFNHPYHRITNLVVDQNQQHKGVGQGLINAAVRDLKGLDTESVDLIYEKKDDKDGRLTRFYDQIGMSNQEISNCQTNNHTNTIQKTYIL